MNQLTIIGLTALLVGGMFLSVTASSALPLGLIILVVGIVVTCIGVEE
jgi:hypothetical protein